MGSVALIFGNEVGGVPEKVLALCNVVLEIPMRGKKESLNVSVSAGIVLFEIAKKI
jgi:tRNA G18 (ribose-2'-O)-methylase SpoU